MFVPHKLNERNKVIWLVEAIWNGLSSQTLARSINDPLTQFSCY